MSSKNPISNILSASSKTKVFIFSSFKFPSFICFNTLPAVPTIIWASCSSETTCGLYGTPPHSVNTFIFCVDLRTSLKVVAIWVANSLVGAKIKDWTLYFFLSRLFIIGKQKARVFPLPVFARAIISFFSKLYFKLFSWIGVNVL